MYVLANKYKSELESKNEVVKNDVVLNCLNNIISATENIKIASKVMDMSAKTVTINATEEIFLNTPSLKIGNLFGVDFENKPQGEWEEQQPPESQEDIDNMKMEYDSVLTFNKFNNWYIKVFKPFTKTVKAFMQKYNQHTHGMCPPPISPEEAVTITGVGKYDNTIKLKNSLETSTTVKVL